MKWDQVLWKSNKTKLTVREEHHPPITTTTVMTTKICAMAQINTRRQEIIERLTLDVKWQAQIKLGEWGALMFGNEGRVTVWGRNGDYGRTGLGYLSIVCTPCSRRVFNSTPRAGLGFLRDSNIQQLSVSEGAFNCLNVCINEWRSLILDLVNPFALSCPLPLTALKEFPTGHVQLDHLSITPTERECAESRCRLKRS